MKKEVVIVSAVRTPIGSFLGGLSSLSAVQLGSVAIENAFRKIQLDKSLAQEVFMGNVIQANAGQAPAKQVSLGAGLPETAPCTTVNKVCASGMKAVIIGAQSIKCEDNNIVVCGGMESMSQTPHYVVNARKGSKFGDQKLIDGLLRDGLTDAYELVQMGVFADRCAEKYHISREEQDEFAVNSYQRAATAWKSGKFNEEVIPVSVPQKSGEPLTILEDEEYRNINFEKMKQLSPAFQKNGTVTAANASTLSDGASALILMSAEKAEELNIKPLARIVSYADASLAPQDFPLAPAKALPLALKKAGLSTEDIDFYEINEAFSTVGVVTSRLLNVSLGKINVNGGAVALGHPLGNSGSRILVTLINVLKQNQARYGAAAICNGGGGASAVVIENVSN
ncbi:MAG: acetyl-CoA C-acyltransferase [Flavobacteriaceae bacterium]|jgi:acetyl-CoA C-acetyltransferase|nr:acetyl-CoA C-acyltransferase [Flavobacteriaceae bacterium]